MGETDLKRAKVTVAEAHIPTWLKAQLREAARRAGGQTYSSVGWHLAKYHPDDFELEEHGLGEVTEEEIEKRPTRTLRQLFQNEEHPRAEFVDQIPPKRRKDFLRGLTYGLADEPLPEWDA